jgi:acetyl-CoA carboxylase biotin carboxyl carrier protein
MAMRKEEIEELIRLVEESQINELEIWEGKRKIRISKGLAAATQAMPVPAAAPAPAPAEEPSEKTEDTPKLALNLKQVVSPMVGTFYRAPAPEADPFIEIGQTIQVGQTICIVEAMKVMNEIGSDFSGVVRQVLIDNSEPVEYGQPLFLVETK